MEYKDIPIVDTACRLGIHLDDRTLGRTEVEAYCPFCHASHNHLFLNTKTNQYFCQRCKTGGNSVTLYARMRGISNKEAFEELEKQNLYLFPQPIVQEAHDNLAPLEIRHDVYYDLLQELSLASPHRMDLLGRGLSLERIEQNMYRTLPASWEARNRIAAKLAQNYDLRGVPGFFTGADGTWRMAGHAGILIPYCTADGYIQGLQIRLDKAQKRKYRWLSTNPQYHRRDGTQLYPNGTAAHVWTHITGDINSTTATITEGALKGDISSHLERGALYVCVPGVGSIQYLAQAVRTLPNVQEIRSAFDMDQISIEKYAQPLQKMIKELEPLHIPVQQMQWDPAYNGIDEYKLHCRTLEIAA